MRNILALFFVLFSTAAFSQKEKVDSLLRRLQAQKPDSERVNTLNELALTLKPKDPAKALSYAEEAFALSKQIHYDGGLMMSYQYRAEALRGLAKPDEALAVLKEGVAIAYKNGFWRSVSSMHVRMGYIYSGQGKYTEAVSAFRVAAHIADSLGLSAQASDAYRSIGSTYAAIGEHDTATVNYIRAIEEAEKAGEKDQVGYAYIMLGNSQQKQNDYPKALESFNRALELFGKTRNQYGIAGCYISIGNIYLFQENYTKALENYQLCLSIREKTGDVVGAASVRENIGTVLLKQDKPEEALTYFQGGLQVFRNAGDFNGIAATLSNLGTAYLAMERYVEAETAFQQAIEIARPYQLNDWLKDSYQGLSELYFKTNRFREAYLYKDSLALVKEQILGEEHAQQAKELEAKFQNRKKEEEIAHLRDMGLEKDKVQQKQQQIIVAVSSGLGVVLLLSFFLFRVSAERRKANLRLEEQNQLIAEKNKDITDSITYASRIQRSVMPDERILKHSVNDYFILNRPRDIVSGDFFWLAKKEDRFYIAVADCTGHGVPGALVSVIGITMLNKVIEMPGLPSPSEMLEQLHGLVLHALNKDADARDTQDGMDLALLCIDRKAGKAWFSGAARPLFCFAGGQFEVIRSDRYSIAGEKKIGEPFTQHEVPLNGPVKFYLSSDGFADQFGEASGKKFLSKRFQELLNSVALLPMSEQKERIEREFLHWKGNLDQVDDVLVVGLEV